MNDCAIRPLSQSTWFPEPPATPAATHTVAPVYQYVPQQPVMLSALMTSGAGSVQHLYCANGAIQVISQPVISIMV